MSVLPSQFDVSKLAFGEIKSLANNSKSVNMNYAGGPLLLQVSNVDLPYGLNADDKFGPVKYSINLSLNGYDTKPKMKEIFDMLEAIDDRVTSECVEKNWLKKPGMTQQILKQMKLYKPTVKFSEDSNTGARKPYPPTVKVALRQRNGKFETSFFDVDKKEIKDVPIEDLIVKRMSVSALIECTGVWVSSVGCGLSWKLAQLKVVSRPDSLRGYGFQDDEDSSAGASKPTASSAPQKASFAAAFDDEEEEEADLNDEELVAPVVAAPAAAKPKVIQKKKVTAGAH
uniref:Uncharacterized protein n=1 Tax=viral metagenome TaxID=1070528 RepID=A0A6C0ANC8_9ZZZZ